MRQIILQYLDQARGIVGVLRYGHEAIGSISITPDEKKRSSTSITYRTKFMAGVEATMYSAKERIQ